MMSHIEQFGEIPIERYWKLALTDPQYGYYVHKNVFSK
jgi:SAM-dependent MidA family methyltransferase